MSALPREPEDFLTVDAYLELERVSEVRHELVGGRIYAMSGGSDRHDLAAAYLTGLFLQAYTPQGCVVFPHNRLLKVDDVWRYPDVLVRCGRSADEMFEEDALILVEVISPDSAVRDRRDKAANYAHLPSLQAYLVVDPDRPRIEVYLPEDGRWVWRVFGPGSKIDLGSATVDLDQLYAYVDRLAR